MAGNANSGGRNRKPQDLHVVRGTYRADRHGAAHNPTPPAAPVTKPERLSEGASLAWDELAPICIAMGTLTPADVVAFSALCELLATSRFLSGQKDGRALTSIDRESDEQAVVVVVDAVLRLERETASALRPFLSLFGLEPVSRARIQVPKKPVISKWAGVLP